MVGRACGEVASRRSERLEAYEATCAWTAAAAAST